MNQIVTSIWSHPFVLWESDCKDRKKFAFCKFFWRFFRFVAVVAVVAVKITERKTTLRVIARNEAIQRRTVDVLFFLVCFTSFAMTQSGAAQSDDS